MDSSAISCSALHFSYDSGKKEALRAFNLEIPQGAVYGLAGPNGAGKTTLLRILAGVLHASAGELVFHSDLLDENGILDRKKLAVLTEQPGVYKQLSILEYLEFFAALHGGAKSDVQDILARFLVKDPHRRMGTLSQGTLQKVQLVRCLQSNPRLLLLDEPTSSMDPLARKAVWELLKERNGATACTILVCSHHLEELSLHCSYAGILRHGRMIRTGTTHDVLQGEGKTRHVRFFFNGEITAELRELIREKSSELALRSLHFRTNALEYDCDEAGQSNLAILNCCAENGLGLLELSSQATDLLELYREDFS